MERCNRPQPPLAGNEKEVLLGFLDFLRGTVVCKLEGLSGIDARRTLPPSTMSCIAIVQHLQFVERSWFRDVFLGEDVSLPWTDEDPDADWRVAGDNVGDGGVARYREEVVICNRIVSE